MHLISSFSIKRIKEHTIISNKNFYSASFRTLVPGHPIHMYIGVDYSIIYSNFTHAEYTNGIRNFFLGYSIIDGRAVYLHYQVKITSTLHAIELLKSSGVFIEDHQLFFKATEVMEYISGIKAENANFENKDQFIEKLEKIKEKGYL